MIDRGISASHCFTVVGGSRASNTPAGRRTYKAFRQRTHVGCCALATARVGREIPGKKQETEQGQ